MQSHACYVRRTRDGALLVIATEAGCIATPTEDWANGSVLHGVRVLYPFAGDTLSSQAAVLLASN